jgi:hypothetical protein
MLLPSTVKIQKELRGRKFRVSVCERERESRESYVLCSVVCMWEDILGQRGMENENFSHSSFFFSISFWFPFLNPVHNLDVFLGVFCFLKL